MEHHRVESGGSQGIKHVRNGQGNGPIDDAAHAQQQILKVRSYKERDAQQRQPRGGAGSGEHGSLIHRHHK
jgi:hypothetical protein